MVAISLAALSKYFVPFPVTNLVLKTHQTAQSSGSGFYTLSFTKRQQKLRQIPSLPLISFLVYQQLLHMVLVLTVTWSQCTEVS